MTTDPRLDERLRAAFEIDIPLTAGTALDGRLARAIDQIRQAAPTPRTAARHRRMRRRAMAVVGIAAVLVGAAASPAVRQAFDGWFDGDFDSVWDHATVIDQSVVDEGYRVTLVRAYADPVGLYLAMTLEDLEDRDVSETVIGMPTVVDAHGRAFPPFMGGGGGADSSTYDEGLHRYRVPVGLQGPGVHRLTADLSGIGVRDHDPPGATPGFPYETLWRTVPGSWTFEFDLEFHGQLTADPDITASHAGIDVTWTELAITPAATIITLQVIGLDPTEPDWGWTFGGRVERNGQTLDGLSLDGILDEGPGPQTLVYEMAEGREDLSGTWTITIDTFETDIPDPDSDVTTERRILEGPWVLTFEGPASD